MDKRIRMKDRSNLYNEFDTEFILRNVIFNAYSLKKVNKIFIL